MSNRVSPEPGFELAQLEDNDLGSHSGQPQRHQQQQQQQQQRLSEEENNQHYRTDSDEEQLFANNEEDSDDEEVRRRKQTGQREYLGVVREGERATPEPGSDVTVIHAQRADEARPVQGRLSPVAGETHTTIAAERSRHTNTMSSNSRPNTGGGKPRDDVIGSNNNPQDNGCCAVILTILSYFLVIIFLPLSLCATIKVVQEYERAVIFRLGRLVPGGAKGPGIFFVMPCIEEYSKVDLRTVSFDVPPQEVLTRDSVTVSVDAVVYYRISNPTVSVANVENAANSTQLLAQTTLRNVLGTQNLAEILSNREHISEQMQNVLDDATDKWGIKVERVEIKDVRLPTQLQRAMAAEAEAARDARAKVIAAEGEQKASVALKEAAEIIHGSPAALQLRYLQTLNSISAEKNSTIIFPLPIELVTCLMKK